MVLAWYGAATWWGDVTVNVGNNERMVTNDRSSNHAKIVEWQKQTYAEAVKAQNEECVKEMKQHVTAASSH